MTRAVVFDLWDTLAAWPHEDMSPLLDAVAMTREEWAAHGQRGLRWIGPFPDYLDSLGLEADARARALELRTEMTRRALVPVDGGLDVLRELRGRGLALGLISNCSSEVGDLWEGSAFSGLFDTVVLSAQVGLAKPDPRIFRLALEQLGVEPANAVFVGDGETDELPGARAVGLRAIQVGSRDGWPGERVESLGELLELL